MKNSNPIFAAIIICLMLISCSNDDEKSEKPDVHINLLVKTTDSDGYTSTYSYDSNNRLENIKLYASQTNPYVNENFTYNTDGTLHKMTEANGIVTYEFFYDANKKIIMKIGRNGLDIFRYTYKGNVITEDYRLTNTNSGWRNVYTYDEKGNISEIKSHLNATDANPDGTTSSVRKYTYDDKNRVTYSLPEDYLFPESVNNIKTSQVDDGPIVTRQYEYNEDGFPTKRTTKLTEIYEYKRL